VQSHVHCFPIKVAFAKDTKHLYQLEFADFFRFLKQYEIEKKIELYSFSHRICPRYGRLQGVVGQQKLKHSCYCCAVATATLVTPQPKHKFFRGNRCRMPKCYHHDMLTEATLQAWMEQKLGLEEEYPYLVTPPDL
jgi:hypothetical protein